MCNARQTGSAVSDQTVMCMGNREGEAMARELPMDDEVLAAMQRRAKAEDERQKAAAEVEWRTRYLTLLLNWKQAQRDGRPFPALTRGDAEVWMRGRDEAPPSARPLSLDDEWRHDDGRTAVPRGVMHLEEKVTLRWRSDHPDDGGWGWMSGTEAEMNALGWRRLPATPAPAEGE